MSTISAGTTSTTTLIHSGDTTGSLVLKTNDTGSGGTTAVTIGTDQSFNFSATGQRITGDFSNATVANRVMFQTSTTNSSSVVGVLPNGTGTITQFAAYGGSDPANAQVTRFDTRGGTESRIESTYAGTPTSGTYLPMTFYTGGSERMRVDTSGNVGIGTSSPDSRLTVQTTGASNGTVASRSGLLLRADNISTGFASSRIQWTFNGLGTSTKAYIEGGVYGADYLAFSGNGSSESMRIDSSDNLLVGNTSATGGRIVSEPNSFNPSGADNWKKGAFNGRGTYGGPLSFINTGGASDGFVFYLTNTPSQLNIQFGANGGSASAGVYMTSTATSWTAQSDERLKDITSLITDAVQSVSVLRPVRYTLKEDTEKTNRVGLIAQDVQKVLPEVVDTDANGYLGVRYSEVVPLLVAAIQEQQALIQQLQADVAALKGTP